MHDFHYNFIKNDFDAELLLTDTECLTYEIKSKDVYGDFLNTFFKDLFDFGEYQSNVFDLTINWQNERLI